MSALIVAIALAIAPAVGADTPLLRVELRPQDYAAAEHYLENVAKAHISARHPDAGTIEVIAPEGDLPTLWLLGEVTILERSRPLAEIQAERAAEPGEEPEPLRTYPQVLEWMDVIEARHPEIAMKVNLTQMLGVPQTWEGRDIYAMKVSDNVAQDEDELAFLVDSLHHSNEIGTIEMTIDVVNTLTDVYGTNPTATGLVDDHQIWVVPVVNPDGLAYVWSTNNMWRKNRRNNGGGIFGVDLNRNYDFLWGVCGNTSGNPGSSTYRGPAPVSEPEVRTMVALGKWLRPTIYLSYHCCGREVLPPYRCANLAESPIITAFRDKYRARMSYSFRPASASGESFEWFYNQISSIGFLTEIASGRPAEVKRVRPGWIFLLESLDVGPLVQGNVTDAVTGAPIEAEVSSSRVHFTEGERRACEPDYGRYAWFLPPTSQTLTFAAPGYRPKSVPVSPAGGITIDVELDPIP